MKTPKPRGLDLRRARSLLARARPHPSVPARVEAFSASLLGAPYEAHGLVGSAETPEVYVAPLDRFDCVTYVETVLALARADDPAGFVDELRAFRYDGGAVAWDRRNHYMTDWARRNARRRAVRAVATASLGAWKEKRLDAVPGLPPKVGRFRYVPTSKLRSWEPRLRNGDLLLFVSTKRGLDVFHCGLLALAGGTLRLRHASLRAGRVVEEDLRAFLRASRAAGVVALRPQERSGASA